MKTKIDLNKVAKSLQATMESIIVFANVIDGDTGFFGDFDKFMNSDVSIHTLRETITGKIINIKSKYIEIQRKDGDVARFRKKCIMGVIRENNN